MIVDKFIRIIHLLFILFVLFAPLIGNELLLTYHFITIPFLLLHWITNNDTCALTLMESKLTGTHENETFMASVIKPIYNAHLESKHFYWVVILLFLITTYRLHTQFKFKHILLTWKVLMFSLNKILDTFKLKLV